MTEVWVTLEFLNIHASSKTGNSYIPEFRSIPIIGKETDPAFRAFPEGSSEGTSPCNFLKGRPRDFTK